MLEFDKILAVDKSAISQRKVYPKRKLRIDKAILWSTGTQFKRHRHIIWSNKEYAISLNKPGKEAEKAYTGKENKNDMSPTIIKNGIDMEKKASFTHVIESFESVSKNNTYALELVGCLLFRNAFLLDHEYIKSNGNTTLRYVPNKRVTEKISEEIPLIYGIPVETYIHYLDSIAWNEDVKYFTFGRNLEQDNVGGRNNMLTYVNFIAIILGKKPLSSVARLLSSGVAAITQVSAFESFPHIKPR